jgi:hypothetical protein
MALGLASTAVLAGGEHGGNHGGEDDVQVDSTISFEAGDMWFTPGNLHIEPGETLKFEITNTGNLTPVAPFELVERMRASINVLGPLPNPAGADAQILGVYDPELVPIIARALTEMPVDRALVVHGSGMDEIGIHDETTVAEVDGDEITEYTLTAADLGLDEAPIADVAGGTPEENAADLEAILTGDEQGPKRDLILANAGAAIYIAGEAESLTEGVKAAAEAIDTGGAAAKLAALRGETAETAETDVEA